MKVQIVDPEEGVSDFLKTALKSKGIDNVVTEIKKESSDQMDDKNSLDAIKIRQLEQKQEFLVGLTDMLFKKLEELHPTQKFTKFELTDLSWYKNSSSSK